jgi:hypothetical protein
MIQSIPKIHLKEIKAMKMANASEVIIKMKKKLLLQGISLKIKIMKMMMKDIKLKNKRKNHPDIKQRQEIMMKRMIMKIVDIKRKLVHIERVPIRKVTIQMKNMVLKVRTAGKTFTSRKTK